LRLQKSDLLEQTLLNAGNPEYPAILVAHPGKFPVEVRAVTNRPVRTISRKGPLAQLYFDLHCLAVKRFGVEASRFVTEEKSSAVSGNPQRPYAELPLEAEG
jgi:hypothetical protein